jgi:hypothetical protein
MFVKTLKATDDQSSDRDEIQKKLDDLLKIENAVLNQFDAELSRIFGRMSNFMIPAKPRAMVQNIKDIRRLLWTLLNSDCVQFFTFLTDLRSAEFQNDGLSSFSIFRYSDDETHNLINRLSKLAKDRIYQLKPRVDDSENHSSGPKNQRNSLDSNYGNFY